MDEKDPAPFGETSGDIDVEHIKPRAVVKPVVSIVSYPRDKPVPVEEFIDYVKSKRLDAPDHELSFDYKVNFSSKQYCVPY